MINAPRISPAELSWGGLPVEFPFAAMTLPVEDFSDFLRAGGIPGQPGPDTPEPPPQQPQPGEPGEPTVPDQPPPAPVA
ncbi:hypothetical protein [Pseudomonas indica]|uniref:hypothetical protein n=1 Tax=Pseudomonas indica TaxID=137658 RepID=UPI0023F6DCA4|nr:hypothetical protein [Pseudomonas indica]MBU3059094.1 hypothetical protein [Pseudomonas indica]